MFKIKTQKVLSEQNIKQIIAMGISLKDSMESIEQGLIEEYDSSKIYVPNMACYYNDYLYRCLFTTTGEFDINSWKKVGDSLELVNKAQVEAMLGLTPDELQTLSSIILDSEIRLDKTHSSSRIYSDLQQCLSDSKKFTLEQFAKANKASYHVVSATSEMTDKSVIYLMSNNTNYDMYIVQVDGTPTKIGDTTIDLSQYAKLSDLDNYYDKATSDGKYATITTVNGKVDKTSILSTISSTPSDDKLLSEKAIDDTFVKKTEIDNKVDKTDIVSVLDSTVTNKQLVDGKTLVDKFNSIEDKFSRRYNFEDKSCKSVSDRKSAIKTVLEPLKKDGVLTDSIDYYENNSLFLIRYNGGYYYTYIMTSYFSKVFILEYSVYDADVVIWVEDEQGELFISGTIPITKSDNRIVNPFTSNTDKYKLYDGSYTLSGTTCTLTVSIDCLSPASSVTDVGLLDKLNFKTPNTPRTFDLKAEDDSTSIMRFYLGSSACQVWLGTAGKRYTGTVTYTIK